MEWDEYRKSRNVEDKRHSTSGTGAISEIAALVLGLANRANKCEVEVPLTKLGVELGIQSPILAKPPHELQGIFSEPTVKAIEELQDAVNGCKGSKISPQEFSKRFKSLVLAELDLADGTADGVITRNTLSRKTALAFDKLIGANEKNKFAMIAQIEKFFPETVKVSEVDGIMTRLFQEALRGSTITIKIAPPKINPSEETKLRLPSPPARHEKPVTQL